MPEQHAYEPMPGPSWFPDFCCRICHLSKSHPGHVGYDPDAFRKWWDSLVNDGLGVADGHGHAGDKDDEDDQKFVHASGIGKENPSPVGPLVPFSGEDADAET